MITYIKDNALKSLATRKTLKVLKILITRKPEIALLPPEMKINSTRDIITIIPSNKFIMSLVYYYRPYPVILRTISIVNMIVKIKFIIDKIESH